ncbi:sensor domain-containing phosphodiesterase [Mangrovihabitans endophyticus]|uniref:EAL domain-containing protein n=1 Tax=Mangrovihabitans endophyticus TaxID=1751298 RepID=A0A8J3C0M7_9ACTN|nr:EAL domain-containing protein [Mangrovihabitans endophyticus]GGK91172.1 hypothetical protein GCM10012284_26250 [Mangrovihabitans endophyticus]
MADLHAIIDERAVTTVLQPLVELAGGRLVGYEALSRGPHGSPWEKPAALFAAARAAGRDGELDWVCRASAYRAAAGLDPRLALFVNMEPAAARVPCPPDLAPAIEQGGTLRVVTEMTERAIARDPAALLAATSACRAAGRGVALDDVGADPGSLALMPFVRPDVVKLDMDLLRRPGDPGTARIVAAVSAYAESSAAVVLAEGIETPRQCDVARTMGAAYGQGWLFGRPGTSPPRDIVELPLPMAGPEPGDGTPFEIVTRRRRPTRASKADLLPLSRHLEALATDGPLPPVLLACFQHSRHFGPVTARRYARIARTSPLVAALGVGLSAEPAPGVRGARLSADDRLGGEWNVLVVGPHQAAALVARDLAETGVPDADRRFDFVLTHDRDLVIAAARPLLRFITPTP